MPSPFHAKLVASTLAWARQEPSTSVARRPASQLTQETDLPVRPSMQLEKKQVPQRGSMVHRQLALRVRLASQFLFKLTLGLAKAFLFGQEGRPVFSSSRGRATSAALCCASRMKDVGEKQQGRALPFSFQAEWNCLSPFHSLISCIPTLVGRGRQHR